MARQMLAPRKVAALRTATGLPVVAVAVRGNTDHRRDLWLEDGTITYLHRDGTLEPSEHRHSRAAAIGEVLNAKKEGV